MTVPAIFLTALLAMVSVTPTGRTTLVRAMSHGTGRMTIKQGQPLTDADPNDWAWEAIHLKQVAHFAHFKTPIKIAIIDDGFDTDNPIWASHITHNMGEIPGNDIDDDHNGKIDDYQGWDFGDNDEDPRPNKALLEKESHGTRVLGVLWQTLQQLSAADLANVQILPIKAVSDKKMNNYLKEGYNGIGYAIEQKANIILCSWSGPLIAPEEKALLEKARQQGIMIIAAAGNFFAMQPMYPGAIASVLDVAALDKTGRKLHVSNYGMFVDICAPGDSLLSYDPFSRKARAYLSATSAATPVVAAVVAAIRSAYPGHSIVDIERILKNTATPVEITNPLYAGNLGAGIINVSAIKHLLEKEARAGADAEDSLVYRQPKAFVNLDLLSKHTPARIIPYGRYQHIKLLLPGTISEATTPDIRLCSYNGSTSHDTIIRRTQLKYPVLLEADSIHIYAASDRPAATRRGKSWYYYEVGTIDSSTFYCGGAPIEVKGASGTLEDGSGDHNYTGRNDCKWQITVSPGKKVRLHFRQFDTEPKLDQVYIFNGNSTKDPILAIFSGHKLPPSIKSWGNTVLVWFLTSEENNFGGWKLDYSEED